MKFILILALVTPNGLTNQSPVPFDSEKECRAALMEYLPAINAKLPAGTQYLAECLPISVAGPKI